MSENKKRISLKDIAAQAGVSTSLVSFVLNGKAKEHRVNADAAARIIQIAKELNYQPNAAAKSLRDGRTRTIGVVVSDISNPFFANIARHIESAAEKHGYTVHFASSDENSKRMAVLVDNMLNKGVDCLIIVPCEGSEETIKMLDTRNIPLVLLDRYIPGVNTNYVCLNNWQAGYDATQHLIEQGFRNIGLITYNFQLRHLADRTEGYIAAMQEAGLKEQVKIECVNHANMQKSCESAVRKILESKPDALIFATNTITVECLYFIRKRNIIIPDQLGIIGFDGGSAFEFFYSPLTYILQPLEQMAQKAVAILVEQLESPNGMRQHIEIAGNLEVRPSSLKNNYK